MADLRPSEVKYECQACNGHGEVDYGWWAPIIKPCGNCNGTGKIDWVRRICPLKHDGSYDETNWK